VIIDEQALGLQPGDVQTSGPAAPRPPGPTTDVDWDDPGVRRAFGLDPVTGKPTGATLTGQGQFEANPAARPYDPANPGPGPHAGQAGEQYLEQYPQGGYAARAGPAGAWVDHVFTPEADTDAARAAAQAQATGYAAQQAAGGEAQIRADSALPREWPGGYQGNPVDAERVFQVPKGTLGIRSEVAPQPENAPGGAGQVYPGGGPQVQLPKGTIPFGPTRADPSPAQVAEFPVARPAPGGTPGPAGPAPTGGGGPAPAGGTPGTGGATPAPGTDPGAAPTAAPPAAGEPGPSIPLGAVNAVSLPAVATGAGAGAQAGAKATESKGAGGKAPIVEAVNPNYKSPPGTKEQLAQLDKDIEKVLAVRAAAEARHAQADATHEKLQAQKGQITVAQKGVQQGQSATEAHDAMIKRKQEANTQREAKQKEGEGHTSDAASQIAGIATLETLLSGWAGFTGLVLKFSDVLPGGVVSSFQSMNSDATKFMQSLVKTRSGLEGQKAQQPGQAAEIASAKGAIAATGTQAAATKGQFTQAQTGAAQLAAANEQQTSFVAAKKAKAAQDAAQASEGAGKLQAKKTTLAAQVEAWAQEHKAARMKAIEETVKKVEATGAKVTKKPTG
jgi:hypothetical protein